MASFVFRIDEIRDDENALPTPAVYQTQPPSIPSVRSNGRTPRTWWFCNGQQIYAVPAAPEDRTLYKTHSVFYCGGYGFWIMRGDATRPFEGETWQPLRFDHDAQDGYSSFITNVGDHGTLRCTRSDQRWAHMLLPNTYHGSVTTDMRFGALKGDLSIFLALIAFSIQQDQLAQWLPRMMVGSRWQAFDMAQYGLRHGRDDRRGVRVEVYTCPSWNAQSNRDVLEGYEEGHMGKYYY